MGLSLLKPGPRIVLLALPTCHSRNIVDDWEFSWGIWGPDVDVVAQAQVEQVQVVDVLDRVGPWLVNVLSPCRGQARGGQNEDGS